ncbi:hypothetical protein AC1031_010217 [Aphanomyces cochlioides]|nr:hypothetical protein AC1031_010217 [Aphanomyces cochlioides]
MSNRKDVVPFSNFPSTSMAKVFTREEVAKHNTRQDCWVILGEPGAKKIYDVTPFLSEHPGGSDLVMEQAGQDANDEFEDIGHSADARKMLDKLLVGTLKEAEQGEKPAVATTEKANVPGSNSTLLIVSLLAILAGLYFQYASQQPEQTA